MAGVKVDVDAIVDAVIENLEEVRMELVSPSMSYGDPEYVELVRDLTDRAHRALHEMVYSLTLSDTPGADLPATGRFGDPRPLADARGPDDARDFDAQ